MKLTNEQSSLLGFFIAMCVARPEAMKETIPEVLKDLTDEVLLAIIECEYSTDFLKDAAKAELIKDSRVLKNKE